MLVPANMAATPETLVCCFLSDQSRALYQLDPVGTFNELPVIKFIYITSLLPRNTWSVNLNYLLLFFCIHLYCFNVKHCLTMARRPCGGSLIISPAKQTKECLKN